MRAVADAIALEHPRPLGILGLAARFSAWHGIEGFVSEPIIEQAIGERLTGYDLAALLGWVRRFMERPKSSARDNQERCDDVAGVLWSDFEGELHDQAWALCKLAGAKP